MRKYMTREEAEASEEKAARFVEAALHDPEHADVIRDESLDDRIARKRIRRSVSPHIIEKEASMLTKKQLQNRVRELESENDELQDQLDQIFDIVAPENGDGNGDDGDEEDKDHDSRED